MALARRTFIGAISCAAAAGVRPVHAQVEIKCGSDLPIDHPSSVRLTQMWSDVRAQSKGRINVHFYPHGMLGRDAAMFSQLRLGALQFHMTNPATLAAVIPAFDLGYLGFAYKDEDEGLRTMDGAVGGYLRTETIAKGLYSLRTTWNSGMFQIGTTSRAIRTPDDLRGLKIRVAQTKIASDLFRDLGASPVPLSGNEVYTSLQTHLVEGESAPLVTIQTERWFEVNRYISLTNHAWSGLWLIANGAFWKSLPADLQEIVERSNTKYAMLERRDTKLLNASLADKLGRQGLALNSVDQNPFRARLRAYYQSWAASFGPTAWQLLESSLGRSLT